MHGMRRLRQDGHESLQLPCACKYEPWVNQHHLTYITPMKLPPEREQVAPHSVQLELLSHAPLAEMKSTYTQS